MKNENTPNPIVMMPSMMKIHAHPGLPLCPSRFALIAAARRPPKEPENAAAEKKIAWDVSW